LIKERATSIPARYVYVSISTASKKAARCILVLLSGTCGAVVVLPPGDAAPGGNGNGKGNGGGFWQSISIMLNMSGNICSRIFMFCVFIVIAENLGKIVNYKIINNLKPYFLLISRKNKNKNIKIKKKLTL